MKTTTTKKLGTADVRRLRGRVKTGVKAGGPDSFVKIYGFKIDIM